jgi:nucleotide-binding universal stress UspA family protein
MFRSVLVPLDGSPFGDQALTLALSIARRAAVPLHVVHVHVPLLPIYAKTKPGFDSTLDPQIRERGRKYLNNVVERLSRVPGVPVSSALLEGTVPEAIQAYAEYNRTGLIVMTTHGRGPLSRFWLGSVADQMTRCSAVPLLLVHPHIEAGGATQEQTLPHILIALDGSELAERILEPAVDLGRLMDADYTLLRVVEPLQVVSPHPMGYSGKLLDMRYLERLQDEAKIYLERVARRWRGQSLRVETCVVGAHGTASAILTEARKQAMSLIALETHGRRGVVRWLMGSVADKVIRGSMLPALIARPSA